ncbi:hypothetical protein RRG08_004895 [Elysia crispata]|uniref:Uncharacterized protein n=1 Tax=Elysia crispata TaxID=231223 RepID=A0AAE0ZHN6_9GAST|nr:hypothetical protein RRG08_004895 [Elysia crispata]
MNWYSRRHDNNNSNNENNTNLNPSNTTVNNNNNIFNNNQMNNNEIHRSTINQISDYPHSRGNCRCNQPKENPNILQNFASFKISGNQETAVRFESHCNTLAMRSAESAHAQDDFLSRSYPNAVLSKGLQAKSRLTICFDDKSVVRRDHKGGR